MGRGFRYEWFIMFPWLCYSPSEDGAYCLYCDIFGAPAVKYSTKIKKLFTHHLRNWNGAAANLKNHETPKNGFHKSTTVSYTVFANNYSGKTMPISLIMASSCKAKIIENKKRIVPIIDTIKRCGRLCIALRGHCDKSQYYSNVGASSSGQLGNFIDLLNYRVRGGDTGLGNHLGNNEKHASYLSAPVTI